MSEKKDRKDDAKIIQEIAQRQITRHLGSHLVAQEKWGWPNVLIAFDGIVHPTYYGDKRGSKKETVQILVQSDWLETIKPWYTRGEWLGGTGDDRGGARLDLFPYHVTLFTHAKPVPGQSWCREAHGVIVAKWGDGLNCSRTNTHFVGLDDRGQPFAVARRLESLVDEQQKREVDGISDLAGLV